MYPSLWLDPARLPGTTDNELLRRLRSCADIPGSDLHRFTSQELVRRFNCADPDLLARAFDAVGLFPAERRQAFLRLFRATQGAAALSIPQPLAPGEWDQLSREEKLQAARDGDVLGWLLTERQILRARGETLSAAVRLRLALGRMDLSLPPDGSACPAQPSELPAGS